MTHATRHMLTTFWCLHMAYLAERADQDDWDDGDFETGRRVVREHLAYARQHEQWRWLHQAHGS
jgi:hypothetical protein